MTDTQNVVKKSILITDDDRYNRDFYMELLTDAGYSVETAEDGAQCIEKLEHSPHFDLVLLDVVMPVKDGMETITYLSSHTDIRKKHGKIFMLSALGQESVLENAKKLGADGYIVKTDITPDQFLAKIQGIFSS